MFPATVPADVRVAGAGAVMPISGMPDQLPVASAMAAAMATLRAPAGTTVIPPPVSGTWTAAVAVKSVAVAAAAALVDPVVEPGMAPEPAGAPGAAGSGVAYGSRVCTE